jgi:hypothetical protein
MTHSWSSKIHSAARERAEARIRSVPYPSVAPTSTYTRRRPLSGVYGSHPIEGDWTLIGNKSGATTLGFSLLTKPQSWSAMPVNVMTEYRQT